VTQGEGLSLASGAKVQVAEQLATLGRINSVPKFQETRFIERVEIETDGKITVFYGADSNIKLTGKSLSLKPTETKVGNINWTCESDLKAEYLPDICSSISEGSDTTPIGPAGENLFGVAYDDMQLQTYKNMWESIKSTPPIPVFGRAAKIATFEFNKDGVEPSYIGLHLIAAFGDRVAVDIENENGEVLKNQDGSLKRHTFATIQEAKNFLNENFSGLLTNHPQKEQFDNLFCNDGMVDDSVSFVC